MLQFQLVLDLLRILQVHIAQCSHILYMHFPCNSPNLPAQQVWLCFVSANILSLLIHAVLDFC